MPNAQKTTSKKWHAKQHCYHITTTHDAMVILAGKLESLLIFNPLTIIYHEGGY